MAVLAEKTGLCIQRKFVAAPVVVFVVTVLLALLAGCSKFVSWNCTGAGVDARGTLGNDFAQPAAHAKRGGALYGCEYLEFLQKKVNRR